MYLRITLYLIISLQLQWIHHIRVCSGINSRIFLHGINYTLVLRLWDYKYILSVYSSIVYSYMVYLSVMPKLVRAKTSPAGPVLVSLRGFLQNKVKFEIQ